MTNSTVTRSIHPHPLGADADPRDCVASASRATLRHRGDTHPATVLLAFHRDDPFAVTADMSTGASREQWRLSREQLITALDMPVGLGDIAMESVGDGDSAVLQLTFPSHDVDVAFTIPRDVVSAFLARTQLLVPVGSETITLPETAS